MVEQKADPKDLRWVVLRVGMKVDKLVAMKAEMLAEWMVDLMVENLVDRRAAPLVAN